MHLEMRSKGTFIEPTVLARGQYLYGEQNLPPQYFIENDGSCTPSSLPITVRTSVIAEYSTLIHRKLTEALRKRVPTGYRKDLIPTIKLNVPSIELFILFYEFMVTKDDREMMRTLLPRECERDTRRFRNMPVWLYVTVESFLHVPVTPEAAPLWNVYAQLRRQLKCPNHNPVTWA